MGYGRSSQAWAWSAWALSPFHPQELPPAGVGKTSAAATLEDVAARVRQYVEAYHRRFGQVLAVERYRQVERGSHPLIWRERELVSDYLRVPGQSWVGYRDVREVDGRPVGRREERLRRVLEVSPQNAPAAAERCERESARYNLGDFTRTFNLPTVALELLTEANRVRVVLEMKGEERVDGQLLWVLVAREREPGVLVRRISGDPATSEAVFKVDPATGSVVGWALQVWAETIRARIEVRYRFQPKLGMLLPAEMSERYESPQTLGTYRVEGRATYSESIGFAVDTWEQVKP